MRRYTKITVQIWCLCNNLWVQIGQIPFKTLVNFNFTKSIWNVGPLSTDESRQMVKCQAVCMACHFEIKWSTEHVYRTERELKPFVLKTTTMRIKSPNSEENLTCVTSDDCKQVRMCNLNYFLNWKLSNSYKLALLDLNQLLISTKLSFDLFVISVRNGKSPPSFPHHIMLFSTAICYNWTPEAG